jgi:N,N'-diacetyllegionaminate synthase
MSSEPRWIPGFSKPCLIIGEVGQAHDGSLGLAHAFIDAIAAAGADAVKFQTHIARAESTAQEPWRVAFSHQDRDRYAYWKRMEFTEDQWAGLKLHASDKGLLFLSSPFSLEALELLLKLGVAAWKVPSGETGNELLLERMAETGLPVLVSTGMSFLAEVDRAVARWRECGVPVVVMQCTSSYPCPPQQVGLNMISFFRERYGTMVGLSDHSGTIYPGLAAATLGISALEVHVTLSREMFGPDVASSITTQELRQLVTGVRFIEQMAASPVDKDTIADTMMPVRRAFTKSIVTCMDLPAGSILQAEHLVLKKPGTGISPSRMAELVGCRLRRDVAADQLLSEDDLELPVAEQA